MRSVEVRYGVTFGKCDSSDWIDYEVELTDEEEIAYDNAIDNEIPLEDVPELKAALERAYAEIEDMEIQNGMPNKIYVKIQAENSPTGQAEKRLTGGAFFDQKVGRKVPPSNNKSNKYVRNYEPKEGVSL